mmetsp:Transcript_41883/g.58510  ORF Transcript_41883/g.58510 Transcript_41883/m.58510 type:complete len:95 (+) Transcript_41883:31-315(+)
MASGAPEKVLIQLKATGNAPQLKKKKFYVTENHSFAKIIETVRKHLRLDEQTPLFCFINSSFQPHPEENVGDLAKCFSTGKSLIVNYCLEVAWG